MMRSTCRPAILPASFVACRCVSSKYAGNGDDRVSDRFAQKIFRRRFQSLQHDARKLRRAVNFSLDCDVRVAVLRIHDLERRPCRACAFASGESNLRPISRLTA